MQKDDMACQQKVFSRLAQVGIQPKMLSDEMQEWINLSCMLGMPEQEISGFLLRTMDWRSILESILDYDLTPEELSDLKSDFFAGKLNIKQAVDKAKTKSDEKATSNEKAKSATQAAKSAKIQGKGSSG